MKLKNYIKQLCEQAAIAAFTLQHQDTLINKIEVTQATAAKFGHYQCNSAMRFSKLLNKPPREIAQDICQQLPDRIDGYTIFADVEIAGPGFINFTLHNDFIAHLLSKQLQDSRCGVAKVSQPIRTVIDFSSPNIAKEMHVGHLRSTIIGDCLARVLEFVGHDVLRLNHLGDWGTQFGMLIAYLKDKYQDILVEKLTLADLMHSYRQSKLRFDNDEEFKKVSQLEVVKLQAKEQQSIAIWEKILHASQDAYHEIYQLLDIKITDRGESFYNPMLQSTIDKLQANNLVEVSDGAQCIYLEGFKNRDGNPLPLIVKKQDGGFNYATTDLAAIDHRANQEQAKWIIYVTDSGQGQHFQMVFTAAKLAKFVDNSTTLTHIPFGLVLKEDGKKFKTRSGDTEKLIDLIDTAIAKSKEIILARNPDISEEKATLQAKTLGINAIKYADLSTNRTSNYVFSYPKMLQFEGNTAACLLYAYVRINSIMSKAGFSHTDSADIELKQAEEISLAIHMLQFAENIDLTLEELLPNRLTEYLFKLAEKFHSFFHACQVIGTQEQQSRLMLCYSCKNIFELGFKLLGLNIIEEM